MADEEQAAPVALGEEEEGEEEGLHEDNDEEQGQYEEEEQDEEDEQEEMEQNADPSPREGTNPYMDAVNDQSVPFSERLSYTLRILREEHENLRNNHMKDYQQIGELKAAVECSQKISGQFEQEYLDMCHNMGGIRQVLEDMQTTVTTKLTDEGLQSWLEGPQAHPADKKRVSEEKSTIVQGAQARVALARAAAEIPKAEERIAKLEQQLAKAVEDAQVAAEEAEEAEKMAAEARKAAELKKKAEEEAARKAEIVRKKKEEEERKIRQEEERRRAEETRLAGSPEELERRQKEAERRNPKNWPQWVYSVDQGDMEVPLGCVIRCIVGGLSDRDALTVERIDQLGGPLILGDNEELVSNIIQVRMTDPEAELRLEEPLAIAIPHCAPRVVSREPVVKMLEENGKWTELPVNDASFDDIKEYKFVEARLSRPATLAVVTRVRRETFNVSKKGAKVIPVVDSRVCISFKPAMYKNSTQVALEIQPVELSTVSDVKYRHRDQCEALLASSPILNLKLPTRKLNKAVSVQLPVPPNPNKKQRPTTAVERNEKPSSKARPTSAFMPTYKKEDANEDLLHLLYQNSEGIWIVAPNIELSQAKNKDFVVFTMEKEAINRMLILRLKNDVTVAQTEKIANLLEHSINHRVTQILCRQKTDDPWRCLIQCLNISKVERYQRKLDEDGYETGPSVSKELIMKEGQKVTLNFRGNIRAGEGTEDLQLHFVFNSHVKTRIDFSVVEIDTFAQKGIDCYRGFAQLFTRGMVEREVLDSNKKKVKIVEEGDMLLTELLISLPKPPAEAPKPITRAPVVMKNDDLVSNDLLHHLAAEIGEEWKKLAQHLSIRRVRIQAILRNNVNGETEASIYDMLVTWAKKVPRSTNKVELLSEALMASGRPDLVEELKDKENDFRRVRALSARDSNLKRSFVKVAQNAHVAMDWKYLCRQLGLREPHFADIENQYTSMRDRCFYGLEKWKQVKNETASVEALIKQLKRCKYHDVAAQVKHVIS